MWRVSVPECRFVPERPVTDRWEESMKWSKFSYKTGQFFMFAGPAAVLLVLVMGIPLVYGVYLTFTSWDGVSNARPFVGLANYSKAFADSGYWQSLNLTVVYSVISVVLINVLAFLLAYLVTSGIKGQNFFRAGFFIPNLIGGIVLGYVWKFVFNRAFVALASASSATFAVSPLSTAHGALFCLIIVSVWQYAGFMMLIYIAGFMGVDSSLKEAALIDGCSGSQAMWHVTIPLMRASFVQCIFLSTTRCFMVYDVNLSLTNGEPFNSSVMAAMHVYNEAFLYKNYGVGQAESLVLFIICAVIGMLQVYFGKKGEVEA
jgi:raffinose/stachyose/melibiose transport system permease protein